MNSNCFLNGYIFDLGLHYNWCKRKFCNDPNLIGENWLNDQIFSYNQQQQTSNQHLDIPLKNNGQYFELKDLNYEQKKIAYAVLTKIIEWITYDKEMIKQQFQPLYMTIIGKAGSGKSYLIKTLITIIRKFTKCKNSVIMCGPTGML